MQPLCTVFDRRPCRSPAARYTHPKGRSGAATPALGAAFRDAAYRAVNFTRHATWDQHIPPATMTYLMSMNGEQVGAGRGAGLGSAVRGRPAVRGAAGMLPAGCVRRTCSLGLEGAAAVCPYVGASRARPSIAPPSSFLHPSSPAQVVNNAEVLASLRDLGSALGMKVRPYTVTTTAHFNSYVATMAKTGVLVARHGPLLGAAVFLPPGAHTRGAGL